MNKKNAMSLIMQHLSFSPPLACATFTAYMKSKSTQTQAATRKHRSHICVFPLPDSHLPRPPPSLSVGQATLWGAGNRNTFCQPLHKLNYLPTDAAPCCPYPQKGWGAKSSNKRIQPIRNTPRPRFKSGDRCKSSRPEKRNPTPERA